MKGSDRLLLFFADYWDDMWRRRQQLAWLLAQSDLVSHVVYIERPLPVSSLLKFLVCRADRDGTDRWRRLLSNRSWVMPVGEKLSVLTTFAPLPPVGLAELFQVSERIRDRWLLHRLRGYFDLDRPVVWVSHPQISVEVVQALKPRLLWYDCTEDFSAWPGLPDCVLLQIKATDRWLTEHADVVTAVSRTLYEEKRQINHNTHWLPNAVDADLFLRHSVISTAPPELRCASRPVLAFVGTLNEWAHDWNMLDQVATLRPEWTILLIGPLSVSPKTQRMLASHPNILCVGQKPYEELSAYLIHSDVCFQFYRPIRKNNTGNSQKLFLYFAAGKPVVSTPSADVETYSDYVYLARNVPEFIARVEDALDGWTVEDVEVRKRLAAENSWEQRVLTIVQIIKNAF